MSQENLDDIYKSSFPRKFEACCLLVYFSKYVILHGGYFVVSMSVFCFFKEGTTFFTSFFRTISISPLILCPELRSSQRNLTPMRLGRNQEEVLELHTFRRRALGQFDTFTFAEEEGDGVSQLHACKVNTNAASRTSTKRMESGLGIRREGLSKALLIRDPAVWVEAGLAGYYLIGVLEE